MRFDIGHICDLTLDCWQYWDTALENCTPGFCDGWGRGGIVYSSSWICEHFTWRNCVAADQCRCCSRDLQVQVLCNLHNAGAGGSLGALQDLQIVVQCSTCRRFSAVQERERGLSDFGCSCTCCSLHLLCLYSPIVLDPFVQIQVKHGSWIGWRWVWDFPTIFVAAPLFYCLLWGHPLFLIPTNNCHNRVCVLFDNCNLPWQLSIRVDSNFSLIWF